MARPDTTAKPRIDLQSWPVVSAIIATLALAVGYADLWRGGITVAPLLITVGYVVLVPMAILAVPRSK